jgi:hypothetical protein
MLQQMDCLGEMTFLGCYFLSLILPKGRHKLDWRPFDDLFFFSNILDKRKRFLDDLMTRYFFILPFVYR